MSFVHLHNHSHFSLLDGLTKIDDLVEKAKLSNMPAVALTDHGVMYGAIEFYQKMKLAKIKPIIGVEAYIARRTISDRDPKLDSQPYHLTMLAKNEIGYKNLSKLVSISHLQGFYYRPRMDKELLKQYSNGLIILTGCLASELARTILSDKQEEAEELIKFYLDTFGRENVYLEIQSHPELKEQGFVNHALEALSKQLLVPLVATGDSHYLNHDDQKAHEVLLAVSTGKDIDDADRLTLDNVDLSFATPEEMQRRFAFCPQAVENTLKVAGMVDLKLDLGKHILPKFPLPADFSNAQDYLEKLAWEGLTRKYPNNNTDAQKRLNYELSVIKEMGFADYFLIVHDLVAWAKNNGIVVGPGRGSATGVITSYSLDITGLDPLKYDLLFERFLNPGRKEMPDIDLDFADDRRDEVLNYVQNKYGQNNVAQIVTFGTMAARGSVRDVSRAIGKSYATGDRIAKLIPGKPGTTLKGSLRQVKEFRDLYETEAETKEIIDMAIKLEGVARHASTHACGVIIADQPLTEYLPLATNQKGPMTALTQYGMNDCASIGLLKIDFLGLANLTIIKNTLRILKKTKKITLDINKIPPNDKKTFRLLARAETTGVFQLESEGMKRYLKELRASTFEDIIAIVALYRPGPMDQLPAYLDAKHGRKQQTYLHPKLEPILKNTYGIGIYQEQMMRIATDLAGYSLQEADDLRKAIGKKIKKLLEEQHEKLVAKMIENDIDRQTAEKIWELFPPFARYGFNKSHAASYALLAYQTAYLKAHYPTEFMAALLTSDIHNLDRISIEITEAERLGLKILPPDVNESFVEFGVVGDGTQIRFGIGAIKNVGQSVAETIVEERRKNGLFKTLEDFITRSNNNIINKKTLESLAMSGALDALAERQQILTSLPSILHFFTAFHKEKTSQQINLFDNTDTLVPEASLNLALVPPASKQQRLSWEKELLSVYITEHPLAEFKAKLERLDYDIDKAILRLQAGEKVVLGGIITQIKTINTKAGEAMAFATLDDGSSAIELVIFPRIFQQFSHLWQNDKIILVKGEINLRDGQKKILVSEAEDLESARMRSNKKKSNQLPQRLSILLNDQIDKTLLGNLKEILENNPGNIPVIFNTPSKKINTTLSINVSLDLIKDLEQIVGLGRVELIS